MYFLEVFLCMFSSRAIPRMDSPLRFAFCTALHLAVCNGVGFLRVGVAVLRTRLVPLRPEVSTGRSVSWLVSESPVWLSFATQTVGRLMDDG